MAPTAAEIINILKMNDYSGWSMEGTKPVDGHNAVKLFVGSKRAYDLMVWNPLNGMMIDRINLADNDADELLSRYV